MADPDPPVILAGTSSGTRNLSGIGGWLILFAIALALEPITSIRGVLIGLRILHGDRYRDFLTAHPAYSGLLLFEAASGTILLIASVALNVALYQRKKIFPFWIIALLAAQSVVLAITQLWLVLLHSDYTQAAAYSGLGVAESLIWIAYFLRSQRVKQTFVN
ncbi:MAG TPA: DUF2569 domain-containing protein [Terracidiphilus sp.]|nr:DUF2569 domain-containing protein [Terracidiphilus sp.]